MATESATVQPSAIKASEVVSSMGKVDVHFSTGVGTEAGQVIRAGQKRRQELLDASKNKVGRDVVKETRARRESRAQFNPSRKDSIDAMKNVFGNGEKTPTGDFEQSKNDATKAIDTVTNLLTYTTIRNELQNLPPGATENDVYKNHGIDQKKYQDMRSQSLDAILNNPEFQNSFGELFSDIPDKDKQRALLEQTFLSHPDFQKAVATKMAEAQKQAQELPPPQKNEKILEAEKSKKEAELQIQLSTQRVIDKLKQSGAFKDEKGNQLSGTDATTREAQLKKIITENLTVGLEPQRAVEFALSDFRKQLEASDPDIRFFNQGYAAQDQLVALEADIKELQAGKGNIEFIASRFGIKSKDMQDLLKKRDELKDKKAETEKEARDNPTRLDRSKARGAFINALTSEGSMLTQDLRLITESQKQITEAEDAISKEAATVAAPEFNASRLRQENEVIDAIEAVIPESIQEIYEAQYDKLRAADSDRISKLQSQYAKDIVQKLDNNWIRYDRNSGQKIVDGVVRKSIAADMRFLAYEGEDGVKRLLMRDLGILPKNDKGENLYNAYGRDDAFEKLTEEQKGLLEDAYQKFGADYSKRLLTDFFMARGFTDRIIHFFGKEGRLGTLALKDHELKQLTDHFGQDKLKELFDNAATNKDNSVLDDLRKQGIAPDSQKGKLLLAIFASLGFGAVASAGIGSVAMINSARSRSFS